MSAFDSDRTKKSSKEKSTGSDRSFNVAMIMIMVLLVVFGTVLFIKGSQEDAEQNQRSDAQQLPLNPSTP